MSDEIQEAGKGNALVEMIKDMFGGVFKDKVTPKKLEDDDLFLFACTSCKGVHFRHAGYVEMMMPFMQADKQQKVTTNSYPVQVCVKCRKAYVWADEQMYDVTDKIDLDAWDKCERDMMKATGPGGNC